MHMQFLKSTPSILLLEPFEPVWWGTSAKTITENSAFFE